MLKYIICILIFLIVVNSVFDHGEIEVSVTKQEMCRGPKRKNCTTITVTLEKEAYLKFDAHINQDLPIVKAKIIGMLNNKELLKLHIKNICDHIFFRPVFMMFFNQTERCGFLKGHYVFDVDIPTLGNKFFGGSYIYGNWTFLASFWNDYCNVHCEYVYSTIAPKKD